jgi:hypothetical protein
MFSLFLQQVGDAGPTAHVQPPRDPFQAHRRFLAPPPRQRHFYVIPFAPARQVLFFPASPPQFLPNDAPGLFFPAFPAVRAVMAGPNTLLLRRQQFLEELLTLLTDFLQSGEKSFAVLVVLENILPAISTIDNVVNRSRILHAQFAGHPTTLPSTAKSVNSEE